MSKLEITRHLPGRATHRDFMDRVKFIYGKVDYVSKNIIRVLTDAKQIGELGVVILIGETYVYWCPDCQVNIWEDEKTKDRGACPFCLGARTRLELLKPGDRMKLHFREVIKRDKEGQMLEGGAGYWGEKVR